MAAFLPKMWAVRGGVRVRDADVQCGWTKMIVSCFRMMVSDVSWSKVGFIPMLGDSHQFIFTAIYIPMNRIPIMGWTTIEHTYIYIYTYYIYTHYNIHILYIYTYYRYIHIYIMFNIHIYIYI